MSWKRLTVNLEPSLAEKAVARAASQRRSFAAYVARLIEADVSGTPAKETAKSDDAAFLDQLVDRAIERVAERMAAEPKQADYVRSLTRPNLDKSKEYPLPHKTRKGA